MRAATGALCPLRVMSLFDELEALPVPSTHRAPGCQLTPSLTSSVRPCSLQLGYDALHCWLPSLYLPAPPSMRIPTSRLLSHGPVARGVAPFTTQ